MVIKSKCLALAALVTAVIAEGEINLGEKKIIGGQTVHRDVYTAIVALEFLDPDGVEAPYLVGEGTLISKWTVLTTADVVYEVTNATDNTQLNKYLHGRVGTNKWKEGGQMITFCRGVIHPNYNNETFKYNVGLLHTSAPVTFSRSVHPLKIDFDHVGANVPTIIAGWGAVSDEQKNAGITSTDTLQQLFMITVDGAKCAKQVTYPAVDPAVEICAINSKDHGTCSGDGGSALIRLDRGTVIGHSTWGVPCATGVPDIFARLSAMKEWLLENIIN